MTIRRSLLEFMVFTALISCAKSGDTSDTSSTDTTTVDTTTSDTTTSDTTTTDTSIEPLACTGVDSESGALLSCVYVDSDEKSIIHERVVGFNLSVNNHGLSPWDNRIIEQAREVLTGHIRYPASGYVADWASGQLSHDWALRFEPDDSCDPTDANACETDDDNYAGETCSPQPTAASPDDHMCQRVCSTTNDCGSGQICMFGQCAVDCYDAIIDHGDDQICEDLNYHTVTDENGNSIEEQNQVERKRECYRYQGPSLSDTSDDGFGCLGEKVAGYLQFMEVSEGKGFYNMGDLIRLTEVVGAQLLIHVNSVTDDSASAGDLARELIRREVEVGAYLLAIETFYFRSPNSPPTLWADGWSYGEDMEAYTEAINLAYSDNGLETPTISLSFSDHETSWQSVWDDGKDHALDPSVVWTNTDNKPGLGDYIQAHGRSFTGSDFHWYPGNGNTPLDEAEVTINDHLPNYAYQNIDDYYLPLSCADTNGVCDDPENPEILVTEFNVQTTWGSTLAAVHASEFLIRTSVHPRVSILGFHSLVDGCMDTSDNHRYSAIYASTYNDFGTFDSNALAPDGSQAVNFGTHKSISCLALELVNGAINTSEHAYLTTTESDDLPDDPDEVITPDTGDTGEIAPTSSQKLYSQAYAGELMDFVIFTNRSDSDHLVTPYWDGEPLQRDGQIQMMDGESPENRNCYEAGDTVGEGEICSFLSLSTETTWTHTEPVLVPAWSVVRLQVPRIAGALPAVSGLLATAGPRSATITFSPVNGATDYDIRWGVTGGQHTRRATIDASECSSTCTYELSNLAHEVEFSLTATALDGDERGVAGEEVSFTPTRVELFTGVWGTPIGNATWNDSNGVVQSTIGSGVSMLPMVNSDGSSPSFEDFSFSAEFRINNCSCAPDADSATACNRFGLMTRFTDDENHMLTYVEHRPEEGCYFRITRNYTDNGVDTSNVLAQSPIIGDEITVNSSADQYDKWGETAYPIIPIIDDNQWHELRFSSDETVLRVWLDGRLITSTQEEFITSGSIGIFSRKTETEWRVTLSKMTLDRSKT
jgi:hypothetical protein